MSRLLRSRSILLMVTAILLGLLAPFGALAQEPGNGLGLLPSNYEGPLLEVHASSMLALPPAVDLSANLPPIGNQRSQNSCVGWAIGYYYKTYQEGLERNWNLSDPAHQFSPAFVYNQRPGDCSVDAGTTMWAGLNVIKSKGALPLSEFPYDYTDTCTQPTSAQLDAAWEYRSDSFAAIFAQQGTANINALKTLLVDGKAFAIAVPVYSSFYGVSYSNPVVPVPAPGEILYGGHAMFVVGYDDAMGGFLTVNSWGSNWARNGYCYLSYDFVAQKAWEGWLMTDHVEDTPSLDISLAAGWNLIGIPFEPSSSLISNIIQPISSQVESVLAWDAAQQSWRRYTPSAPSYSNSLSTVGAGQALWVKMSSSGVLPLQTQTLLGASQAVALQPGWNMVSFCGETSMDIEQALTAIDGQYSSVLAYESGPLQTWYRYDPAAEPEVNTLSVLEPGRGYWIEVSSACLWELPS